MSFDLQQSLSELQSLFDKKTAAKDDVSKRLTKLKVSSSSCFIGGSADTLCSCSSLNLVCISHRQKHRSRTLLPHVSSIAASLALILTSAGSILEIGAFHSLRCGNLKAYQQYNSSLQPFYSSHLPASPNRPVTLGLELLALLSEGKLTEFHTVLEGLDPRTLEDVFVRLPVDL